MQEANVWLGSPGDNALEAGEDLGMEEPEVSHRSSRVSHQPEPLVQAELNDRHSSPCYTDDSGIAYPERAKGQFLWEVFEGPDERLVEWDTERGLGYLKEGFHVEELAEEAEERAERFLAAHRQLAAAFFSRRKNALYRKAAASALGHPDKPEPMLLLLWNLLGDRWLSADTSTQEEVNRWLSSLSEEDFHFFTQNPDGDPQRVMSEGLFPEDLRPMRLFSEQRRRLLRALIKATDFFHPDKGVFEERLARQLPQIALSWHLDEEELMNLAHRERERFYQLHLAVCRASAAFAHGRSAPRSVLPEVVAEVASVAYGRMDHPSYKEKALAFGQIQAEAARKLYEAMDRFTEDFYASRLFSFLKRTALRRRKGSYGLEATVEAFVKTFRTGMQPPGIDRLLGRQVAALALYETYYGGFRGKSRTNGRPNTLYRPQILAWGYFATLEEAKGVYEAIPNKEALRKALFPAIAKMARDERLWRAEALLQSARRAYQTLTQASQTPEDLLELRSSIDRLLRAFGQRDISHTPVLASLKKSLQYLNRQMSHM